MRGRMATMSTGYFGWESLSAETARGTAYGTAGGPLPGWKSWLSAASRNADRQGVRRDRVRDPWTRRRDARKIRISRCCRGSGNWASSTTGFPRSAITWTVGRTSSSNELPVGQLIVVCDLPVSGPRKRPKKIVCATYQVVRSVQSAPGGRNFPKTVEHPGQWDG